MQNGLQPLCKECEKRVATRRGDVCDNCFNQWLDKQTPAKLYKPASDQLGRTCFKGRVQRKIEDE